MIWTDEKKFSLDGPDGNRFYWHDLRKDPLIFSRRNCGGGSIMVWAGFSSHGTLTLGFPSTRMNSNEYQNILTANLLPYLAAHNNVNFLIQQDNAPVHNSRSTRAWYNQNGIQVMDWPACSPDLNPVENIWGILSRRVYQHNKVYGSVQDLKAAIEREWAALDPQLLTTLANSLDNRLAEVLKSNGSAINY